MRKHIANREDLEQRISELEALRKKQQNEFKAELREVGDRLNPVRLIKNGVQSVVGDPELRTAAVDTAISHGAGKLGKTIVTGRSHNLFRKIAGTAVQFIVTNFIRNRIPAFRNNLATHKK
jgi:hypothetical protein